MVTVMEMEMVMVMEIVITTREKGSQPKFLWLLGAILDQCVHVFSEHSIGHRFDQCLNESNGAGKGMEMVGMAMDLYMEFRQKREDTTKTEMCRMCR